jgi:hypothetical protein
MYKLFPEITEPHYISFSIFPIHHRFVLSKDRLHFGSFLLHHWLIETITNSKNVMINKINTNLGFKKSGDLFQFFILKGS